MIRECGDGWHLSQPGARRCMCGETRNVSYRNWWQRWRDHRDFKKLQKLQARMPRRQAPEIGAEKRRY